MNQEKQYKNFNNILLKLDKCSNYELLILNKYITEELMLRSNKNE